MLAPIASALGPLGAGSVIRRSVALNGSTNYLSNTSTAFAFERTTPFSASVWLRFASASPGANMAIMGRMNSSDPFRGWLLWWQNGNGRIEAYLRNTNTPPTRIAVGFAWTPDTNWHHLVWTYDGSSTVSGNALYLDGVARSLSFTEDTLAGNSIVATGTNFNLGSRDAGNSTFHGDLDEAALWSGRVLSSSDVAALYNAGTPTGIPASQRTSLLAHWPLDEFSDGSGPVARQDYSGGGYTLDDPGNCPSAPPAPLT